MNQHGKSVLITGVSSGFGKHALPMLFDQGYQIYAGIRGGQERLVKIFEAELEKEKVSESFLQAVKDQTILAMDLHLDDESTWSPIKPFTQGEKSLDILINNAGLGVFGPLETQSSDQFRKQIDVNFTGTALLIKELLPALRKSKGKIINVSSVAGRMSFPFYGSYNASKFALEGLSEALHYELKPYGVQICLVEPGGYQTEFMNSVDYGSGTENSNSPYYESIKNFQYVLHEKAMNHAGNPAEVSKLLVKLAGKKRLPLRVPVGKDAHLLNFLHRFLPQKLFQWILEKFFLRVFRTKRKSSFSFQSRIENDAHTRQHGES